MLKSTHVRCIATENPKVDQWKLLGQYAYPANIRKYLDNHGFIETDRKSVEFIVGCVRQGEAYFIAAENSPLDIAPLLLYYGTVNLLAGAHVMITGSRPLVKNHGMRLILQDTKGARIADAQVEPRDSKKGALQQFCNAFSGGYTLAGGGTWTVEEILGSIPDLKKDFETCYPGAITYTIPTEIVRRQRVLLERVTPSELARYQNPQDAFAHVIGFTDAYLAPQYSKQMKYIALYRKIGADEIGIYSIFGQKHLQVAHIKNNNPLNPTQLIIMFMGLFALGYLSRYHPDLWNPFVRNDETGEKLVIERFLLICQRYLPNLVLNLIYGERVQFVNETDEIMNLTTSSAKTTETSYSCEEMKWDMHNNGDI